MLDSGIYRIFHIESGKSYIGQSVNVKKRIYTHFWNLNKNCHGNRYLQNAHSLYGRDAFSFEVLEYCSRELLTEREQYWISVYQAQGLYNLAPVAGSLLGYKHSEKAKANHVGFTGKNHSEEARMKMSKSRKGVPKSEETRKKMSEYAKNRPKEHNEKIGKGARV